MKKIETKFLKIGARVKVHVHPRNAPLSIDVEGGRAGGHFVVRKHFNVDVRVLHVDPQSRHLLLGARRVRDLEESLFLCGRDEKQWFVAAIPESARATNVQQAKDALKPPQVWDSIREHKVPPELHDTRRNAAFLRQGEWFFLPRPWLSFAESEILTNEPIRRGAGKPHRCQFMHRTGGETVWVTPAYPNGLAQEQLHALPRLERKRHRWRRMQRNALVYVKGGIDHPDHVTIFLPYWHQVVMNTETQARAMRNVAFLD